MALQVRRISPCEPVKTLLFPSFTMEVAKSAKKLPAPE
jgi:hypothetical protein